MKYVIRTYLVKMFKTYVFFKETYQILCICINVNILGFQCAHSTNELVCYVGLKMID